LLKAGDNVLKILGTVLLIASAFLWWVAPHRIAIGIAIIGATYLLTHYEMHRVIRKVNRYD